MDGPAVDEDEVEPRLYLIGPAVMAVEGAFLDVLSAVFEQAEPAAFLLRRGSIRAGGEAMAGDLRHLAMARGAAFLVEDDLDLVRTVEADGIHLTGSSRVAHVRDALKKNQILGVDAGMSRHDAMTAGDAGADYVTFGQLGRHPCSDVVDLVTWWRDLFVLPCLAHASDADEAAVLYKAGADFIGVSDAVWNDAEGPATGARRLQAAIGKN